MKIRKLTIENFRCFKDKQVIEFDTDGKITLIYGLSGAGKTTLLQFINWVFYGEYPHSVNDNKPLYNQHLDDLPIDSTFKVSGQIEFVHDNVEYMLIRNIEYVRKLKKSTSFSKVALLNYKNNLGSWVEYTDGFVKKINEIIPKALSKYFFFHGEKSLDLDSKNNQELKKAIYTMFDLDKYQNSLDHLGDKSTRQTVIFKYNQLKISSKPKDVKESASEYFSKMVKAEELVKACKEKINQTTNKIEYFDDKIEELTKRIGEALNSEEFRINVNSNNKSIENYTRQITDLKKRIGNILYSNIPYLLLADKAIVTRNLLAGNAIQEKNFAGLRKELLEDLLLHDDTCICGRRLDDNAKKYINHLIDSMPPNSYKYTFNQFINSAKKYMIKSSNTYNDIIKILEEISNYKQEIYDLEMTNRNLLFKLKSFDKTKEDAAKLEDYKKKRAESNKNKSYFENEKIKYDKYHKLQEDLYEKAVNTEGTVNDYDKKISILMEVKNKIKQVFEKKIDETVDTLEKSIKDVYLKLSTRNDTKSGFEEKRFLEYDFTLRKEYKTGGQEVIDIYSYVIGMIYALKQMDLDQEGKEFPVIVDAPFSKTDYIQLSHVLSVLPTVAPQVALFTFDLDRIKLRADLTNIGSVWEIKYNEDQTVSTIVRGEL